VVQSEVVQSLRPAKGTKGVPCACACFPGVFVPAPAAAVALLLLLLLLLRPAGRKPYE
jgi:hypothetical protein